MGSVFYRIGLVQFGFRWELIWNGFQFGDGVWWVVSAVGLIAPELTGIQGYGCAHTPQKCNNLHEH